jgi:hypothetical protein
VHLLRRNDTIEVASLLNLREECTNGNGDDDGGFGDDGGSGVFSPSPPSSVSSPPVSSLPFLLRFVHLAASCMLKSGYVVQYNVM